MNGFQVYRYKIGYVVVRQACFIVTAVFNIADLFFAGIRNIYLRLFLFDFLLFGLLFFCNRSFFGCIVLNFFTEVFGKPGEDKDGVNYKPNDPGNLTVSKKQCQRKDEANYTRNDKRYPNFFVSHLKVLSIVRKTLYDYIWKEHLFLTPN